MTINEEQIENYRNIIYFLLQILFNSFFYKNNKRFILLK